jgi:hypothetical protein
MCLICQDRIVAGTTVTLKLPAHKMKELMRKAKCECKSYNELHLD